MKVKLLSRPELEDLLRRPTDFQPGEELGICTIVEPVLLADLLAKGKSSLDWSVFQQGWDTLLQRGLFVALLDSDCLQRSLFERSDFSTVMGLWDEACDRARSPAPEQSVHRLILRPSEENWWGDECYNQMESWYEGE